MLLQQHQSRQDVVLQTVLSSYTNLVDIDSLKHVCLSQCLVYACYIDTACLICISHHEDRCTTICCTTTADTSQARSWSSSRGGGMYRALPLHLTLCNRPEWPRVHVLAGKCHSSSSTSRQMLLTNSQMLLANSAQSAVILWRLRGSAVRNCTTRGSPASTGCSRMLDDTMGSARAQRVLTLMRQTTRFLLSAVTIQTRRDIAA